ncbi:MAG: tRNA pseudouridine(55) synthase TruB, partial [Calditerrivibrio sp.]|nr:tRNA pseudouridine(55) synthase TruB [Calditerrivibrio sp.]
MNGFINLYKEKGLSSHFNIKKLSKVLNNCKVGHTGTLDPLAEGVLPVCINEATKLASYVMAEDKEYQTNAILGFRTDTFDITGKILERSDGYVPTIEDIKETVKGFEGEIELVIPSYSAVNIQGKRAYELARKGLIENAGFKKSFIYSIEVIKYDYPFLQLKLSVEKGTYIRSVIDRLGVRLGTFATMESLLRLRSGVFGISESLKVCEIEEMIKHNTYDFLTPINRVLDWSRVIVDDRYVQLVKNGVSLHKNKYLYIPEETTKCVFITNKEGVLLAIAEKFKDDIPFRNIRIFNDDRF